MNRRNFLMAVGGLTVITAISSCGGGKENPQSTGDKCDDLSKLTPAEKTLRGNYKYVAVSTDPNKNCANCNFYNKPEKDGDCGGCKLFPGPVTAGGNCSTWIAVA